MIQKQSKSFAQTVELLLKLSAKGVIKHLMKTPQHTNTTNDKQTQRFAFLLYDEDDLLDWDAAIITSPPRPSGTIRVKLIHKGRSKPMPIENPWEE